MHKKSVIVDCDAGIDDALALIILLAAHKKNEIEIRAITCVNGNTTVDNVVQNVFRTLHICNATDIPIFRGACSPLLATDNAEMAAKDQYHGTDGFGDVYTTKLDTNKLETEHAVCALYRITSECPGKVSVICLGPLTNVALGIKMYPHFISNVKEFYVMGGNSTAQGNITSQAEFNFYTDPESVHIVLKANTKPLWLLPWEACIKSKISHEWRRDVFGQLDKPCIRLMNDIENGRRLAGKKQFPVYVACDAVLVAILLRPEIAKGTESYHADIELNGLKTRGQVVLDHLLSNKPNVLIVQDFDSEIFKQLLMHSVDALDHNTANI